jgi:DNA mismatch repair protein MutS
MAGVPPAVVARAREVLEGLERNGARGARDILAPDISVQERRKQVQLTLFDLEPDPVTDELRDLDLSRMTPVEALIKLNEWQRHVRRQG